MPATTPQKESLASNVIWPCDIWTITARDGTVARYASHTRDLVYSGNTYKATPNEPSTSVIQIGLEADTSEMIGVYDDIITNEDRRAGKWGRAAIVKEIIIDYRNPALGTTRKQKGYVGKIEGIGAYSFKLEFRSLIDLLRQKIGDLTSNSDRITTLEALIGPTAAAAFTHATTVFSVTDRRKFQINYVQPSATYFVNGQVTWTSGANDGLSMEIKNAAVVSGKTELELHLPMPSTIVAGDGVSVVRGYLGTRVDAKAISAEAILNSQGEWDIPSLGFTLRYPE
ncbi:MAG: DUF2163 domain-containing protein [Acidobacteriota bacterium]